MKRPPDPATSRSWWAVAAVVGAAAFSLTVAFLHLAQPDYELAHRLMSELVFGPYGRAIIVAFAGLALGVFGIQAAIVAAGASRVLRSLLVVAALLFLAAGIFPLGETTEIHIAAVATAFALSVVAMYLFPSSAGRASFAAPRAISWPLAAGAVVSVSLQHAGVPVGIGQRLAAGCLLAWLIIAAWRLGGLRGA